MRLILSVAILATVLSASAQTAKKPVVTIDVAPATMPEEKYGDWYVYRRGSTYLASTTNASQSAFGVVCGTECVFFFNPVLACNDSAKIPVLINSPAGAFPATLTCRKTGDRNLLSAPIDTTLLDAMEIGGELGVALPMESGQFKVTRFSLTGSIRATLRAYSLSASGQKNPGEKGLRDQTL